MWISSIDEAKYQILPGRLVPKWRTFLNSNANKQSLARFLCDFVEKKSGSALKVNEVLYLAGGFEDAESAKKIRIDGSSPAEDLQSDHEEADTRMIAHAYHFDMECGTRGKPVFGHNISLQA